jgi:hypothetical protein
MALKVLHSQHSASLYERISSAVQNGQFTTDKSIVSGYGLESLDATAANVQTTAISAAKRELEGFGGDALSAGLEAFGDEQLHAGAIAATIVGDLGGYAAAMKAATARAAAAGGFQTVSGSRYGSANMKQGYGTEAFEQAQEFVPQQAQTIEYNIKASKQDPVGEAFFPTTTLTANDIGLDVKIPIDIVEPFIKHKATGEVTDWQRKKLINTLRDPSILRNDAIKLLPYKPADNSNNQWFVTGTDFLEVQGGEDLPTAALKPGVRIGFLGLCSTPSLVQNGVMDHTDQIDNNVRLQYVWIKVTGTGGTTELFRLRTDNLDRSAFQKTQEGDKFQTSLDLDVLAYQLTSATKTVAGVASALLAPLTTGKQTIGLALKVNGTLNHEKGDLVVNALEQPRIHRVYDNETREDITNTQAVKDEIAKLSFEFAGYYIKANLRNSNFRTREQRIDRQTSSYKYLVQLGAPITAVAPATNDWGPVEAVAVEQLSTATYARNSAMAISRLLDYVDSMRSSGIANNALWQRYDENSVEGVGKAVVDPWFGEGDYDISKLVNSTASHMRREDISEQLLMIIRNYAYRMNAESGYNVAIGLLYNEQQPNLLIGTDNIIAQYLMEVGDLRTAGITFKVTVVTSNNIEMKGKIIMTLSRMKSGGLDLCTFGMHLWVPEIVATVKIMRNGNYVQETMVQPRNLHVIVCPIIAALTISGLDESYTGSINVPVTTGDLAANIAAAVLDGLNTQPAP